jgi:CheY-like chemotaxis protein
MWHLFCSVNDREREMHEHILIVDDEANFRFAAGIALRRAGYTVAEAEDAGNALLLMGNGEKGRSFDLLLVDVQMPGMSGIELIEEVRKRNIVLPIFVVSGFVDEALAREIDGKGCFALLHKPFEPGELVEKISMVLKIWKSGGCTCPV